VYCGLAGVVTRVELGVGDVEIVGVEADVQIDFAAVVRLGQDQRLDLARSDILARDLDAQVPERKPFAARGERPRRGCASTPRSRRRRRGPAPAAAPRRSPDRR